MKGEKQNKEPATKARKHQIYENNFSNFSAHKKHTSVYHQKKKKNLPYFMHYLRILLPMEPWLIKQFLSQIRGRVFRSAIKAY